MVVKKLTRFFCLFFLLFGLVEILSIVAVYALSFAHCSISYVIKMA